MKKVRMGLVGGGTIHNLHMLAYSRIPMAEVAAVCALPADVKPFAERWRIPKTYTEIEKICRDPDIDVIDIGLPPFLHSKAAVLAVEQDKGVLCEKPLARNGEEAEGMVEAVRKHGAFNAYLENYSFFPWAEEAKRFLENGVLGKPVWMRFYGGSSGPYSPWFFKPELSGGGCLTDLGCHFIEVHRWILGKKNPTEAFGWADSLVNKQAIEGGTEDYCLALIRYPETMTQCESSWGLVSGGEGFSLQISGTEGTFSTGDSPRMKVFSNASDNPYLKQVSAHMRAEKGWFLFPFTMEEFLQPMVKQMQHIAASYLGDEEPRHTFRDGMIVNKIIDTIYRSAKSGSWESIDFGGTGT